MQHLSTKGSMKLRRVTCISRLLRRLPAMGLCLVVLAGCSLQGAPGLDSTDRKFAAFYSDYLVRSGSAEPSDSVQALPLTSGDLDSLFVRHGIDQKIFDEKLRAYSKDPALWREVLVEVRKQLRQRR